MHDILSFLRDNNPLVLVIYFGTVVAVSAYGYFVGVRAAVARRVSGVRRVGLGIVAGAGASLLHPAHLFVEVGGFFEAGALAALQAIAAFALMGAAAAGLVAGGHSLWRRLAGR